MEKAINLSDDDLLKEFDKRSKQSQKIIYEKLSKRARNVSKLKLTRERLSQVAESDEKVTEKSTSAIISLVSKLVSTLTVGTASLEKEFKTSIASDLLKKAKQLKSSDIEIATQYAFGAKISALALKTITESNAKSLSDFKTYNSEFESLKSMASFVSNEFRQMGLNLSPSSKIVKDIAKNIKIAQESAFQISKSTGESKLKGLLGGTEIPIKVKSTKATEESVASLENLVTKIIGDMSFVTKQLESEFGSNISLQLLAKSKEARGKGNFEQATKYLLSAKAAVLTFDAMSKSSAKTLEEFKEMNPEFKSINSFAENFRNKLKEVGINVKYNDKEIKQLATDVLQVAENAFTFNKATGETNLQGITAEYEKITQQQEKWNKLSEKLPAFYDNAKEALSSNTAATIAIVGVLIDKFADASKSVKEMKSELGLSVPQTAKMSLVLGEAGAKAAQWGANTEDIKNSMSALSSYSGDLNMATTDASANVAKMTTLTNIGAGEASKLNVLFKNTASGSQDIADNLTNIAINTARINNISPQKLMKSVAEQTDKFAGLTKEGAQGLIAATAMAVKLNVEFSKLVDTGEQFLDIQNLIEKTMETNALLGTNFDFSMAAAKYNAGDLKGFVADLSNQFKGIDLSKMSMIEKRQLSSTLGLTPEDLQNIIKNAEKIKNVQGEVTMDTLKNADKLEGVKDSFLDTIVGWATSQNLLLIIAGGKLFTSIFGAMFAVMARMSAGLAALGARFINFFKFAPAASSTSAMTNMFNGLGKINYANLLRGAGALAIISVALIGLAFAMQQFSKNDRLWESFGAAIAGISMLTVSIVALGKFTKAGWQTLLSGAAAMVVMSGALWVLGSALQQFKEIDLSTLGMAALGLIGLTAAIAGLGVIVMNPIGLVLLAAGSLALLSLSSVLFVLGKSLQIVTPNLSIFAAGLNKMISSISNVSGLSILVSGISNEINSLVESFDKIKIPNSLLDFTKNLSQPFLINFKTVSLNLFSESIKTFHNALDRTTPSLSLFTDNLAKLSPSITTLSLLADSMRDIGKGFASMGSGLIPFSRGLSAMSPLIPVLESLANISSVAFKTEEGKTTKSGNTIIEREKHTTSTSEDQLSQLQLMVDDLNEIRDFILSGGANIYIDGKKVGSWLGKLKSNIHALENG